MNEPMKRYLARYDEIHDIVQDLVREPNKPKAKKQFEDWLFDAYVEGWAYAVWAVDGEVPFDGKAAEAAYQKWYDGLSIEDRFDEYYGAYRDGIDYSDAASETQKDESVYNMERLLNTEYHRMYNEAVQEAATRYAEQTGRTVMKKWLTMLDDRVRDTHDYLEGVEVPIDDEFITFDGDSAYAPGGFALPENNINCRCVLGVRLG